MVFDYAGIKSIVNVAPPVAQRYGASGGVAANTVKRMAGNLAVFIAVIIAISGFEYN
ncbi:MAG: hypothetical protein FWG10_01725 [Eubacteriaceae bacterium]|nr:hypothetical protein [Eubacteriaceae bacterium]